MSPESTDLLVQAENAALARGEPAPVRDSDDHVAHLHGHAKAPNADEHIESHLAALRTLSPDLAALLKE